MISRRGLLAGILAAGVAPAIVHNPMKIFVPKKEIFVIDSMSMLTEPGIVDTSAKWESKTPAEIYVDLETSMSSYHKDGWFNIVYTEKYASEQFETIKQYNDTVRDWAEHLMRTT